MNGSRKPRLVCRCLGVASPRIYAVVAEQRLADVADVTKAVRAGGGCGMCHPEIEEILAELRGEPLDPMLALENQMVCRQETLARIGASLESLIRPRLAALGATLHDFEVDGLRVQVRVSGTADASAVADVAAKLRKYVCEDLEVEVRSDGETEPREAQR